MRCAPCFAIAVTLAFIILPAAQENAAPSRQNQESAATTHSSSHSSPQPLPDPIKICGEKNPPPCAKPPIPVSQPITTFSEAAGRNFHGVCTLTVVVEPNGRTSHIHVVKSVGLDLDQRAIEAVRDWRFKPATLDGKRVSVQIAVQITFDLY